MKTDAMETIQTVFRRQDVSFRAKTGATPSFQELFPPDPKLGIPLNIPIDVLFTSKRIVFFPGVQIPDYVEKGVIAGFLLGGAAGAHLADGILQKLATRKKEMTYDMSFINEATDSGGFPFLELAGLACEVYELRTSWDIFGGSKDSYVVLSGNLHYRSHSTKGIAILSFSDTSAKRLPIRSVLQQLGIQIEVSNQKFKEVQNVYSFIERRFST